MRLYLYNPSTEIALAKGTLSFTPPRAVVNFEKRMSLLPAEYMDSDSSILLPHDMEPADLRSLPYYREGLRIFSFRQIAGKEVELHPWGWNMSLRQKLIRTGAKVANLPSVEELEEWRRLAHRRQTARLARLLGEQEEYIPFEATSYSEAERRAGELKKCMLKLPWSSSGRGVVAIDNISDKKFARRVDDALRSQGSIMIEPLYDRGLDFATEWLSDGSAISFLGWSVFVTEKAGNYVSNMLAPQEDLRNKIAQAASRGGGRRFDDLISDLDDMIASLAKALSRMLLESEFPYRGPFGVDGMVCSDGRIVPYVEINLRMTMGHVALIQSRRLAALAEKA